jgi:hypothetical protein
MRFESLLDEKVFQDLNTVNPFFRKLFSQQKNSGGERFATGSN